MAAVEMISDCVIPTPFWIPVNARNADPAPTYWLRKERVSRMLARSGYQPSTALLNADIYAFHRITVGPTVVAAPHRPPTIDVVAEVVTPQAKEHSQVALDHLSAVIATVRGGEKPVLGTSMTAALDAALASNARREPVKSWASKLAGSVFRR